MPIRTIASPSRAASSHHRYTSTRGSSCQYVRTRAGHATLPEHAAAFDRYHSRVGAVAVHHSGLLRFSVNEENMMLKLILILSSSLALASTECCR